MYETDESTVWHQLYAVTHDAYTASFCDRVLFLQDGNLAKEVKKENTADNFREDIWKTLCGLGGGKDDLF